MLLCGLALAQVVVVPPTVVVVPPAPLRWSATLNTTQTVAAITALASTVQLQGLDLATMTRAQLTVQLRATSQGPVAVVSAIVYTNAPTSNLTQRVLPRQPLRLK